MPRETILDSLTTVANEWQIVAIAWHILFAASLLAVVLGWRPTIGLLARLLVLPVASVSAVSWASWNPFNGAAFGILTVLLLAFAMRLPNRPIERGSPLLVIFGAMLVVFGWTYPHFLEAHSWTEYAYAPPFGLLPCPTLAVEIGVTLMVGLSLSKPWNAALIAAGFIYGTIGVFKLGVILDALLLVGVAVLACAGSCERAIWRSVRATRDEQQRPLAGDEFIEGALDTLTHAITVHRPPHDVWRWLAQMGAGARAGWYSYDFLDNGRRASADRIVPELQQVTVGTLFPALPGMLDGFTVLAFQLHRFLVLGWRQPDGIVMVTWAFVLERASPGSTRLLVRARGASGYRFQGLPPWLSKHVVRGVHYVMQRKQLLGIVRHAESSEIEEVSDAGIRVLSQRHQWDHQPKSQPP